MGTTHLPTLLTAEAGATQCDKHSRSDYLAMFREMSGNQVLDVLGEVSQHEDGTCEVHLLTTDGFVDVTFEFATVQGREHFHKLSQHRVPDPQKQR